MNRLLVGTCVLALAVFAVRAADDKKPEEKKSVGDTFESMVKELNEKYPAAKSDKEKEKLLTAYAEKFVDLARKNPKDENAPAILLTTLRLPIPPTKDGPKSTAPAILKKEYARSKEIGPALEELRQSRNEDVASFARAVIDENPDAATRAAAFQVYMGIQEQIIMADEDPKKVAAARKGLEQYRKLIKTDFKGKIKDLYIGAAMPELTSKNLEDKAVKLSDLKGKVVMLDVWATWCGPCKAMIPHSKKLVGKLKAKPFVLVGISVDAKKETLTDFMKDTPMPWTHWWNGESGGVITTLDVQGYPSLYVLDNKGVIRYKWLGAPSAEVVDRAVETLLKEMESEKKTRTE